VLFAQNKNRSEENKRFKTRKKLIIAGGNMAKLLQFVEKTLDKMTLFVMVIINVPRLFGIGFGRNTVRSAGRFDKFANFL